MVITAMQLFETMRTVLRPWVGSVKSETSTQTLLVKGHRGRVELAKGSELVRTAASVAKVVHCALVCPCPCISTRLKVGGWR